MPQLSLSSLHSQRYVLSVHEYACCAYFVYVKLPGADLETGSGFERVSIMTALEPKSIRVVSLYLGNIHEVHPSEC